MTRTRARIVAIAALVAAALGPGVSGSAQDWRTSAIASFDLVWQTVQDTFYDPTLGGLDWSAVRAELRPKAEAATEPDGVRRVIVDMLARLKQSHFRLITSSALDTTPVAGDARPPFEFRVLSSEESGVPGGPHAVVTRVDPISAKAGLRMGDVIRAIDGRAVSDVGRKSLSAPDDRAARFDLWQAVTRASYGVNGSLASVRVERDGAEQTIAVPRVRDTGDVVTLGNLPPFHVHVDAREVVTPLKRKVGVIGFNIWMTAINAPVDAAVDRFRKDAGLVIDLRGNPGGVALMIRGLAGHLLTEPLVLGTSRTREAELRFPANPRVVTTDGRRVKPYAGPVAVLVDELTGSASECFAAGLQSLGRVRIFGQQTMGQALPAATKQLPNGDVLLYAIGDFVTASGRRVEGDGVIPDERVARSVAALASGKDLTLDAALAWIDRSKR